MEGVKTNDLITRNALLLKKAFNFSYCRRVKIIQTFSLK